MYIQILRIIFTCILIAMSVCVCVCVSVCGVINRECQKEQSKHTLCG